MHQPLIFPVDKLIYHEHSIEAFRCTSWFWLESLVMISKVILLWSSLDEKMPHNIFAIHQENVYRFVRVAWCIWHFFCYRLRYAFDLYMHHRSDLLTHAHKAIHLVLAGLRARTCLWCFREFSWVCRGDLGDYPGLLYDVRHQALCKILSFWCIILYWSG